MVFSKLLNRSSVSDKLLSKASGSLLQLQNLAGPHLNVNYRVIDINRDLTYLHLINESDVVIRFVFKLEGYRELCSLNKQFTASRNASACRSLVYFI